MLDSGRRLERALVLVSLLRVVVVARREDALLNQVLESTLISTDSLSIYLRRYRSTIQLPMVLELLLIDKTHPRSVAYQLRRLSGHIKHFPREKSKGQLSAEERLIMRAYTDLRLCNIVDLLKIDDNLGIYNKLDELLSETYDSLLRIADVITQAYFSHSQTSQLMMVNNRDEDEL